jgi:hypothetical protein
MVGRRQSAISRRDWFFIHCADTTLTATRNSEIK